MDDSQKMTDRIIGEASPEMTRELVLGRACIEARITKPEGICDAVFALRTYAAGKERKSTIARAALRACGIDPRNQSS